MTSTYLETVPRDLWKAQADTGRADYFRWTFKTVQGNDVVLSVGKAWRAGTLRHACDRDSSEVLLWDKRAPRVDLMPSDICPLLEPWDRFFNSDCMATYMPDSIVASLLYGLGYYHNKPYQHKASLLNAFGVA